MKSFIQNINSDYLFNIFAISLGFLSLIFSKSETKRITAIMRKRPGFKNGEDVNRFVIIGVGILLILVGVVDFIVNA